MKNGLISQVRENWFLVVFVAGVVIWYANTNSRLNAVEAKQLEQKTAIEQIAEIKTDVAVIKANVDFIKTRVQ